MNRIYFKLSVLLFVFSLLTVYLSGQTTNDIYRIGINTGSFTPVVTEATDFQSLSGDSFQGKYFRLLQFFEIPGNDQRKAWEKQGLVLTDYLPGNAYFAGNSGGENRIDINVDSEILDYFLNC